MWLALTDPDHLKAWAPFDADKPLTTVGPVKLTTVGIPEQSVPESVVTRAEAPHLLEYSWGHNELRWQLEPQSNGTRLTLWTKIPRSFIAMGAAGWHICLDVLDFSLGESPVARIVAGDALKFEGWQRLHAEYAAQFGVERPNWPANMEEPK